MIDKLAEILQYNSPVVQDLISQTRELIFKVVPGAGETVHLGWRTITYSTSDRARDAFCAIDPQRTRINFVFHQGVHLPDPQGLLEGAGKHMRHVKVETAEQLHSRALTALIKAAVKYKPEA